jgi:hypothetical protein
MPKTPINSRNALFGKGLGHISRAEEIGVFILSKSICLTSTLILGLKGPAEIAFEPG